MGCNTPYFSLSERVLERVGHVKVLEARVVRPPGRIAKWVRNHF